MCRGAPSWPRLLGWARDYDRARFGCDLTAAAVVTAMLIPQSLAYASLAGLPPQVGLYASVAPLIAYAAFGGSNTLAVGPVAVISLMTAAAASKVAGGEAAAYVDAALVLALLSGTILTLMSLFRLGVIASLLSHPVSSAFMTASGVLIIVSQVGPLLGISSGGLNLLAQIGNLGPGLPATNPYAAALGLSTLAFLLAVRRYGRGFGERRGLSPPTADILSRLAPIVAIAGAIAAVDMFDLTGHGVRTVGALPASLPPLGSPPLDLALWSALLGPAALISLVTFAESISVAHTLAAKRRERVRPDQELLGLGAANLAAAFTGGYPVAGGLARSAVNFEAGARTPAAGALAAVGIALATVVLARPLSLLPSATLAATIVVAVLGLVDLRALREVWRYSRADFAAMAATILATFIIGVEAGILMGVATSLALHLRRSARPHAAVVGRVPGSEQFRNVRRHRVDTAPHLLCLRVDDSLTFLNARWLEDTVLERLAEHPALQDVVLMCSAVNGIDASGVEALEAINAHLGAAGVRFHLSEVKGPVLDRLRRCAVLQRLTGQVFPSQYDAFRTLAPTACAASNVPRAATASEGV